MLHHMLPNLRIAWVSKLGQRLSGQACRKGVHGAVMLAIELHPVPLGTLLQSHCRHMLDASQDDPGCLPSVAPALLQQCPALHLP